MATSSALGPRLESYVDELVQSGRYTSRDDVLREGVRLIEEREKRLAVFDAALARGIADADAGGEASRRRQAAPRGEIRGRNGRARHVKVVITDEAEGDLERLRISLGARDYAAILFPGA